MGNFCIEIGDVKFEGFKFYKTEKLPWSNAKESEIFFNKCIEEKSKVAKLKLKTAIKTDYYEDMHIAISKMYASKFLSFGFLFISFIFVLSGFYTLTLIFGILSVLYMLAKLAHKRNYKNIYEGLQMVESFVDSLF
jgi:hypothetical protein